MKICSKCKTPKMPDDFTNDKSRPDGKNLWCRACTRAASKHYGDANPDKARERGARWVADNPERQRARRKQWIADNRDKYNEWQCANRAKNLDASREYMRKWDADNKDKRKAYYENNKSAAIARWALREARKLQATPKWANADKIQTFYDAAKKLSELTGVSHNVDHVVPLRHLLVCGLHWEGNMQVLTETANKSKGNRYWPDMPE
jgi:hypothetical protein